MFGAQMLNKPNGVLGSFGSIRFRFVILVLLISMPSLVLMYYQSQKERSESVAKIVQLSQEVSSQVAKSQKKIINDSRAFLQDLALEPFLQTPDSAACNTELSTLLRLNNAYINIGAPLANGDLLCNALPLNKKVNVYDREYIQKALNEKTFSISQFQVDRAAGKVSVNFAYPIMKNASDEVLALIVVVLSLDWWSEQLSLYDLPKDSVAVITDSNNKIIANFPFDSEELGKEFTVDGFTSNTNTLSDDADKAERIFSQTVLFKQGDNTVNFVIGIPIAKAIQEINQHFYRSLSIYLLLILITSSFAMTSLNRNIVNPIEQLVKATSNLEVGRKTNLPANIGAKEIQLLSKRFISMAATRLKAEAESLLKTKELNSVFTALPDTYIRVDVEGIILDYRDGTEGESYREKSLIGTSIRALYAKNIADLFIKKIKYHSLKSKPWEYTEINNNIRTVFEARITKIHNSTELVIIIRDITERKKSEEAVWQHANFDNLTNLPNRKYFYEKLEQSLARAKAHEQRLAVLFIDLDQFKEVNDTLGHHMGDILLQEVANRLVHCVRKTDVVARLGGDEFTIIIDNIPNRQTVETIADNILQEVHKAIVLDGQICYTSPSIGISLFPENCETVDELIKTADQAMFAAKKMGRNRFNYYESAMQEQAMRRMHLISDLRTAIRKQEFHLVYQPIVNISTRTITKVEALIRWNHPERGLVRPDEFIALAEETELIFPIGYWVIQEIKEKMDLLVKHFGDNFQMSVNISPLQFMNQDPVKNRWFEAINELPSRHKIVLEITEGLLMDVSEETKEKFQTFADKEISLAIDDFGTGYSSLAYINQYDIDFLKIDRSFIMNICDGSSNLVLCEAIIVMAHKLGIKVIAEGVETPKQVELLAQMQCDYAQGYYFSKPCNIDELLSLEKKLADADKLLENKRRIS